MKIRLSKEKIIIVVFSLVGVYLVAKSIYSTPEDFDHKFGLCMFKNITGLDCPGCGLSRSFIFLLKGDIPRSVSYHALGIPVFLSFGLFYIQTFFGFFFKRTILDFSFLKNEKFLFTVAFIFCSVYFFRLYAMGKVKILADLKAGLGWKILELITG